MLQVYDSDLSLKLNDIVEFVGVLSNDPAMVNFPDEKR